MWTFALRNLLTRPLRSGLAMTGLSIAIVGIVGLFSVTHGMTALVRSTLNMIEGVVVVRAGAMDPIFSALPKSVAQEIAKVPGVRRVNPELWRLLPRLEGKTTLARGFLTARALFGVDLETRDMPKTGVYERHMIKGRFLTKADRGTANCVISRTIADEFKKQVGDSLDANGEICTVVGIYETGTPLLDLAVIVDLALAHKITGLAPTQVSSFLVELDDPRQADLVIPRIEAAVRQPELDARGVNEWTSDFSRIMSNLDVLLTVTTSIALFVGVVGILNTMLMSTTERLVEFGILKANGWSRSDILRLIAAESAYLGLAAGTVGCTFGWLAARVMSEFLPIPLVTPPSLLFMAWAMALGLGVLGGLYPAYRAARMHPMEAIRLG